MKQVPWTTAAFLDEENKKIDATQSEYVVLDPARRAAIGRRVADFYLMQPDALSLEAAQAAFIDARRIAALLVSDHLARRNWFVRLLGLW